MPRLGSTQGSTERTRVEGRSSALRVEGGLAGSLKLICPGMDNLEDIAISMDLVAPDSCTGLVEALSQLTTIQRCAIIDLWAINENHPPPHTQTSRDVRKCVSECIQTHWKSLYTIYYPYRPSTTMSYDAARILALVCLQPMCRHLVR
ncbi:hypothetical protein BDV98DRAFT_632216 [Pterulicium gracile]|uniref:Uncharacterized protein n=1 Tax=Pterulicium gracile TaxID=1884261 RepID=A0A5C3QB63_9AGAR|nr:hypothetical protein BDV98DRAFT_632216 [Pterula gracilis]